MDEFDDVKPGTDMWVVFKAQPFILVPNTQKQMMEPILNLIRGTFRGVTARGKLLFATEAADGSELVWRVKPDELLMHGTKKFDGTNLASV